MMAKLIGASLDKWQQASGGSMNKEKEPLVVRSAKFSIEWDVYDNLVITRCDNGQFIEVSSSEWGLLLKIVELRGWPTSPPYHARDDKGYED